MEHHGDEDLQHGPAVESSDDSAYDAIEQTRCYLCDGSGVWSTCDVPCRDCNGRGYILTERDTLSNDLFPELSMYSGRMPKAA